MDAEGFPLVEEVAALLAKEALVHALRLRESAGEARRWREGALRMASEAGGADLRHLRGLEAAARTLECAAAGADRGERSHGHVLDVSGAVMSEADLKLLLPTLMQRRKAGSGARVALMRSVGLGAADPSLALLAALLSDAIGLEALDLAHNGLGASALPVVASALRARRLSPQYLMLCGNRAGSWGQKDGRLASLFGPSTWGIGLSLEDAGEADSKGAHKAHPRLCSAFLAELNAVLDRENELGNGNGNRNTKAAPKPVRGAGLSGQLKLNLNRGVETLVVLALTDAQLSRHSLGLLGVTLRLASHSLTDLSLDNALTGYAGARVVADAIALPACALVRLSMRGNALSDEALGLLSSALAVNRSLLHADLSANDATNAGARDLVRNLVSPASFNSVLCSVNLLANRISAADLAEAAAALRRAGSGVRLQGVGAGTRSPRRVLAIDGAFSFALRSSVRLYSVDLAETPLPASTALVAHLALRLDCAAPACVTGASLSVVLTVDGCASTLGSHSFDASAACALQREWTALSLPLERASLAAGELSLLLSAVYGNRPRSTAYAHAQCKDYCIAAADEAPVSVVDQDCCSALSAAHIAALGLAELAGRQILRSCTWSEDSARASFSWSCRLSTFASARQQVASFKSIGYACELGLVRRGKYLSLRSDSVSSSGAGELAAFEPWQRTRFSVPDVDLRLGDVVVLSASVSLDDGLSDGRVPCEVEATDWTQSSASIRSDAPPSLGKLILHNAFRNY